MTDMLVRLFDIPEAPPLVKELRDQGIIIRRARAHEKHIAVNWVGKAFSSGWASECDIAFSNHPPSCFIAAKNEKLIGFACYDTTHKNFFGPTGVARENQGRGIGKALLLSCLNSMAASGYAYAIIGGTGPVDYYKRTIGAIPIEGSSPGNYSDKLIG